jgi:hypothetical protein
MFLCADAARLTLADQSVDLVFGSPPYADARTYGINAQRGCQDWIDWMLAVTTEAVRVSRGLVLWVCAGVTRKWCYWPGPEGLLYEWWQRGGQCWRPAYWRRCGIPGSGGKQWLRADVEYVLAFTGCQGPIPWADNTANGHPPKWAPGGEMSHRLSDGQRVNQWGNIGHGRGRKENGEPKPAGSPSHVVTTPKKYRRCTRGKSGGDTVQEDGYLPPVLANPGNLVTTKTGGGHLGHRLAHDNEAPFPETLAAWFIRSYCPPGGLVLDPFSGSGTTAAAATALGRRAIGIDLRLSQCQLSRRRCGEVQGNLL